MNYLAIAIICTILGLGCMALWLFDKFTQWYDERRRIRKLLGKEAWDELLEARKQIGKGRKP